MSECESKLDLGGAGACLIIAEAGVNHNGELELALRLVDAAREAGADAVKFQTFRAEKLVTPEARQAAYQTRNIGREESQLEMLKRLELDEAAHRRLLAHCRELGILFLSTPFDAESADFLESLEVPAFKLGSGELTNHPLLAHVAQKGRLTILSTGMADLGEVEAALRTVAEHGDPPVALLHCVSNYPAAPEDVNLRAMETLARAFGKPVGYSDHTDGNEIAFAAVALGACVIEKHFTLDRELPGPDHKASAEPAQLAELVRGIRAVEAARGDGIKRPAASERDTMRAARKSLVAAADLPAGTVLTDESLAIKRPGDGIPPAQMPYVLGRKTRRALKEGELLCLEDLA